MGTQERRERERQELRTKILDAARELFAAEGYDAVTMRKIAERIEYSATAIYQHFEDKDALLQELCRHDFREFAVECPQQYRFMFMSARPQVIPDESEANDPAQNAYVFLHATVDEAIQR